jgi:hypothetical protein
MHEFCESLKKIVQKPRVFGIDDNCYLDIIVIFSKYLIL